jgi:formate dehydrogenase maturation protein FdhE
MKYYHIRRDKNVRCGYCGGKAVFEFLNKGGKWQTLGTIYFAVQSNLAFLKMFRRLCTKCGKQSKIEYEIIETKP